MHYPTYWITHTTDFVTPVVEHWLEEEMKSYGGQLLAYKLIHGLCYISRGALAGRRNEIIRRPASSIQAYTWPLLHQSRSTGWNEK